MGRVIHEPPGRAPKSLLADQVPQRMQQPRTLRIDIAGRPLTTRVIKVQAQGEALPFHVLLVHAMDLLMISTSERDIAEKMLSGALKREEYKS